MSLHRSRAVAPLLLMLVVPGCCESAPTPTDERPPLVYVVNEPLRFFAERIGGDHIDVRFPASAAGDPAFWRPDPDTIAAYQTADLILLNGASYAKWVTRATLPTSKMVDTSAAFAGRFIETTGDVTHGHGPSGEHAHAGTAFTTWIDFEQAVVQTRAIHDALVRLRPDDADAFAANLDALTDDLSRLDTQMMQIAQRIGDASLVASHPVYQYWARRYGLDVRSVLWEPEVVPDDRVIRDLMALVAEHPARVFIWEGEPDPRSVTHLETLGLRSVVFDPCGNRPRDGDFLDVMARNLEALRVVFPPDDEPASSRTFHVTPDRWTAGFADLPVDHAAAIYELASGVRPLPSGLEGTGHYVQGHNRSDDLFMFLTTRVDGLEPRVSYRIAFTIDLATSVPPGMVGVGGSPGESVYVKAGATPVEPQRQADDAGYWRMNIDKGNQARDGVDMINLGHVAHPDLDGVTDGSYRIKRLGSGPRAFTATTGAGGSLWIIVGTDSGFEGLTALYYAAVSVTLEPVTSG